MSTAPRRLSLAVLTALAGFVGILVALHVARPDCDPRSRHLSEYAVGGCGGLMTVAFVLAGSALILLAAGFWTGVRRSGTLVAGCLLLGIAGLFNLLMAVFTTDLSVPADGGAMERTPHGHVHDVLAAVHAFVWLVAPLVLLVAVRKDQRWRRFDRIVAAAACVEVAGVIVVLSLQHALPGLGQRIWIACLVGWCATQAVLVARITSSSA